MKPKEASHPIPSVVICLGRFAAQTALPIQNIYFRSNRQRQAVTTFLTAEYDEADGIRWQDLEEWQAETDEVKNSPSLVDIKTRTQTFQKAIRNAPTNKAYLERRIHALRTHERLMASGWEQIYDVPINLYLIADVTDPQVAGMVLPLLTTLYQITQQTRLCEVQVLLSIAVFPDGEIETLVDADIQVVTFLQALDQLLIYDSETWQNLNQHMGYSDIDPWLPAIYLFDHHKEGSHVVKDRGELSTLVGNALLALLQDNLAREVIQYHDENEIYASRSFYNSIGAAMLVYDPASLEEIYIQKAAKTFLETKLLDGKADRNTAIQEANRICEQLGGVSQWMEALITSLPQMVGQIRIQPDSLEMVALLTNFSLAPLNYEQLSKTPWQQQYQQAWTAFQEISLAKVLSVLEQNVDDWKEQSSNFLRESIDRLPIDVQLYPGGIQTAIQVLDSVSQALDQDVDSLAKLKIQLPEKQTKISTQFSENCSRIQRIVDAAPGLPSWLRLLPKFIRQWLVPFYYTRTYGRQLYLLHTLKKETTQLLGQLAGLEIQKLAMEQIIAAIPEWQELLRQGKTDYELLEQCYEQGKAHFCDDEAEFPLGQSKNAWHEIFRRPVVDQAFATWGFQEWQPDYDQWLIGFFEHENHTSSWRTLESDAILIWLHNQGRQAFAPLWQLNLEEIYTRAIQDQLPPIQVDQLPTAIITTCMHSSYPLLHPDFDAIGSTRISFTSAHGILGFPEWEHCTLPSDQSKLLLKWETVFAADPFVLICMQVRHTVSLQSLVDFLRSGEQKFSQLPSEVQQDYQILGSLDRISASSNSEQSETDNPDILRKVFRWRFQPKGGRDEIEQTVRLNLSRSRFDYYRKQPRLIEQWNYYAEAEMPEVRQLALEFQKLHAEQSWSTFNQAYNVLKFVQSCIPYSMDIETTAHNDWSRYPIETLTEETGDCEDVAILCAAVIARLGYSVVLIVYPRHVAFGVAGADHLKGDYIIEPSTGKRYYFGEATANGWHLGEIPKEYRDVKPNQVLQVNLLIRDE